MIEKYVALIFDVVDSRKILDRYDAQSKLKDMTKFLNYLYKDKIIKEVVCGSGDEFQGLFKTVADAYAYIHSLQLYIHPIRVRCGIGYGNIKYTNSDWISNNEWHSTDIDGDAYYRARDAINAIPDKNSIDLVFFKTNKAIDKMLNTIMITGAGLKKAQSRTAKLVELIMDFYFPFIETHLNDDHLSCFSELIRTKLKDNVDDLLKKSFISNLRGVTGTSLTNVDNIDLKTLVFDTYKECNNIRVKDNNFYYDRYYPFGCSTLIAPLTLSTPQNVSKTMLHGRIKENRNLDGAIFNLLKNIDNIGEKEICY